MTPEQIKAEYMTPDHELTPDDYQRAYDSEGGVNSLSLITSLAGLVERINQEAFVQCKGATWCNSHPIIRLYLEQLAHLCGYDLDSKSPRTFGGSIDDSGNSGMTWEIAREICKQKAGGKKLTSAKKFKIGDRVFRKEAPGKVGTICEISDQDGRYRVQWGSKRTWNREDFLTGVL